MEIINLDTLSDRLTYALKETNTTQTELAKRINVKKQSIQYLCSSGTNKSKFAYDIAHALNIDVEWLIEGKGDMLTKKSAIEQLQLKQKIVPILGWNQISAWLNNELSKKSIKNWTIIAHESCSDSSFALKLKDNSMFPRFDSDTTIVIDPKMQIRHCCFVVAYIKEIHETVFRQFNHDDSGEFLYAFNEAGYKKLSFTDNDKIWGCMIEAKWSTT